MRLRRCSTSSAQCTWRNSADRWHRRVHPGWCVFAAGASEGEAAERGQEILSRLRDIVSQRGRTGKEHVEFCEAGAEAVWLLLAQGARGLAEELIEQEAALVGDDPEEQDLRLPYARTLSAVVRSEGELAWREQIFNRLFAYCKNLADDVSLYAALATAALALCHVYAQSADRLADAESKNQLIRRLERVRSQESFVPVQATIEFRS